MIRSCMGRNETINKPGKFLHTKSLNGKFGALVTVQTVVTEQVTLLLLTDSWTMCNVFHGLGHELVFM